MKLYLIEQSVNKGYETFDRAVVCAESKNEAMKTHPMVTTMKVWEGHQDETGAWADQDQITVKLIGLAHAGITKGVVCASYNAG